MILLYLLPHNANAVQEALATAFPSVAPSEIHVESDGSRKLRITLPDGLDQTAVDALIRGLNPSAPSSAEAASQATAAKQAAILSSLMADKLPNPGQIAILVDTLFPDPTYTPAQRAFFARMARLLIQLTAAAGA